MVHTNLKPLQFSTRNMFKLGTVNIFPSFFLSVIDFLPFSYEVGL